LKKSVQTLPHLLVFALCFISFKAFAQEKTYLSGYVLAAQKPLPGATVAITRLKDSSQISSVSTNEDGRFIVQALPQKDSLKIEISYVGYTPFKGLLILNDKKFSMSSVTLQPQSGQMDAVVVKVEKLATVKGDTVEFRAAAIKTPPNSMAGDLLKRVPGLQFSREGKLTYNGRPVTKILVDGKPFFSEDGAVALTNLPADMVEKIQLANDSLQAGVGRIEGDLNHVLNLKLKPGIKYFVNAYAAGGTDDRYDGSSFGSRMADKERISLALGANNINKAGINSNNSIQLLTNGSGITKTTVGTIDYGNRLRSGNAFNASYSFTLPHTYKETLVQRRQDMLPSTSLITNSGQTSKNNSSNQGLNLRYTIGERKNLVNLSGNLSYANINNQSTNNAVTSNGQNILLNALQSSYRSKGRSWNGYFALDGNTPFKTKGKQLQWNMNYSYNNGNTIDHNDALTLFYRNSIIDSQFRFRQQVENKSNSNAALLNLLYNQPLGIHTSIVVSNQLSYRWGTSNKTTWALDSFGTKLHVDSTYSNYFKNNFLSNTTSFSFAWAPHAWNLSLGLSLLQNYGSQQDLARKENLDQKNSSPALRSMISHTSERYSWSLNSSASYTLPSINQLQPVQDLTNPLYIVIGDPNLRPQVNYASGFHWINRKVQVNGRPVVILHSVNLTYNSVHDQIASSVVYDSLGKQTASYKNVNGIYSAGGQVQFSLQKKWGTHFISLGIGPGIVYNKDKTFLNGLLYNNHKLTTQSSVNLNYRKDNNVSFIINYAPSFSRLVYDQNKALNQTYAIHSVNANIDLYLFKKLKLSNAVDYTYNNSLPANFKKASLLWNTGASVLCLKSKKAEISFTAFDMLKQFNNLTRTIGSNYIEDTQSNNVQRYLMAGFKYFFGKIDRK
jgi:hypothetical protein